MRYQHVIRADIRNAVQGIQVELHIPTTVHTHIHIQHTLRLALSKPNTVRHVHARNVANKLQY